MNIFRPFYEVGHTVEWLLHKMFYTPFAILTFSLGLPICLVTAAYWFEGKDTAGEKEIKPLMEHPCTAEGYRDLLRGKSDTFVVTIEMLRDIKSQCNNANDNVHVLEMQRKFANESN